MMKDSEKRNPFYNFFPIKDEPSFFHCGDSTRVRPKCTCVCLCTCVHGQKWTNVLM